jgi:quercetin dioxygenase-like cupin family protein
MITPTSQTWAADDRSESIKHVEDGKAAVLVPGVELYPLVGVHNGARKLFTGLLTLAPKASYPLYVRSCTEVVVLIDGEAAVEVEDRHYRLEPLDAMTVLAQVPRRVLNLTTNRPAVLHLSLASAVPEQTWVNGRYTAVDQPRGAVGQAGAERLCRNEAGAQFDLAPRARFQDLFNADLGAESVAATASSSPAPGCRAIATSSTSQSPSSRERQPAWSKDGAMSSPAMRRHSSRRDAATTSSTSPWSRWP